MLMLNEEVKWLVRPVVVLSPHFTTHAVRSVFRLPSCPFFQMFLFNPPEVVTH